LVEDCHLEGCKDVIENNNTRYIAGQPMDITYKTENIIYPGKYGLQIAFLFDDLVLFKFLLTTLSLAG